MYMHMLPIDDRTPEEREDDRQRTRQANEALVDEASFHRRLDRYTRGR